MKKRYTVNFARHLADCEFNYRRMCRLMPDWKHYPKYQASNHQQQWRYLTGDHRQSQNTVILQVIEAAKYTTTVNICVDSNLQNQLSWIKALKGAQQSHPAQGGGYSLDVRLYHDAHLAEVIGFANQRRFLPRNEYPNPKMHQRDEKSQINLFLGELLDNCLCQGRVEHQFDFTESH